jgi:diaminopimelate decarboxylase
MSSHFDKSLFPDSVKVAKNGHLTIAGHDLVELAQTYGTPFYCYDGLSILGQVERLQKLIKRYYPGESQLAYASKAYFSYAFAKKLAAMGIGADVVSLGEINLAQKAGFSPQAIHLHGNNKSKEELQAALDWGIQAIVVDNLQELALLEELAADTEKQAQIWLRITPDLEVDTHPHIETSHADSKFGLHITNGEAGEAIRRAMACRWLNLTGLHTHLGSQIHDSEPYRQAIEMICELAQNEDYTPAEISPGGGWGVRYLSTDPDDDPEPWIRTVSGAVQEACVRYDWPYPRLVLEPGRWVIARAGVSIYRTGTQRTTPTGLNIVAIDGGLADNPRVALYQAQYSACLANHADRQPERNVRIVGKYCESGDVLISEIGLPAIEPGDLLAIPVSGAYQLSMASNYNYASRPTVLWLEEGGVEVMQQREIPDQDGWLVNLSI